MAKKKDIRLKPKAARALILDALTGAGTSSANAGYFTDAILDTELSGLEGHGSIGCNIIASMCKAAKSTARRSPR